MNELYKNKSGYILFVIIDNSILFPVCGPVYDIDIIKNKATAETTEFYPFLRDGTNIYCDKECPFFTKCVAKTAGGCKLIKEGIKVLNDDYVIPRQELLKIPLVIKKHTEICEKTINKKKTQYEKVTVYIERWYLSYEILRKVEKKYNMR